MPSGTALVLSGEGAKGAFQFGAIKYIEEMNKYQILKDVWSSISSSKVYKGKINWFALFRIMFGAKSILSNKPLYEMIRHYVNLKDINKDYNLRIGVVSLVTGEYRALSPEEFDNDEDFQKAVLASTSIPVIWPPVKEIRIKNEAFRDSVDGGIRNISPLGDVIEFDPSEVIIINCSSSRIRLKEDTKASANIFRIAKRALTEITLDEDL